MSARWWAIGVVTLASTINYLDRQILATLAIPLRAEFHLSNADYGLILSAFSITYALSAPFAGLFIDRVGLRRGLSIVVALWSAAGFSSGLAGGLRGLLFSRAALGVTQAGGIPASGKAYRLYLLPHEWAFGNAVGQIALSLGAIAAPPLATWLAIQYGWRWAFYVTGILGLFWIPLWRSTAKRAPVLEPETSVAKGEARRMLRDRRLWGLVAANVLSMTVYTLWFNWTSLYLSQVHGLTLIQIAGLAPVPHVFAIAGGLFGGWISLRWIRQGHEAPRARRRLALVCALALLVTAAVPLAPSALWATLAISASLFWISAWSVNLYSMPLDIYGASSAAFAIAMLTSAYGWMQAFASPPIGRVIDLYGFKPVCVMVAVLPLAAYGVLMLTCGSSRSQARI
jgi:ACS family hexuronate transporter-like MFS transporter